MIFPIMRTAFYGLRRDRTALLLTFVLPIAFFSIFAGIFGQQGAEKTPRVHLLVADEDKSEASKRLIAGLKQETALVVSTGRAKSDKNSPAQEYDRDSALAAVKAGDAPVAIVIPKRFGATEFNFGPGGTRPKIELLQDRSNPVAPQIVGGLLQKVAMTSMPDMMADAGMKEMERAAGGLTPRQKSRIESELAEVRKYATERDRKETTGTQTANAQEGLVAIETKDVVGGNKKSPVIAFYAAGIGVMFLLFMASGAGGVLLDEAESGALDRVLATQVSLPILLLGKLAYLTLLGTAQLAVMFSWGALVFGLDLLPHIPGFLLMTVVTSLAASALGLLLAASCRTRTQLGAISTLVILTMSALGGSMFPRFIMPATIQKIGLITFNAWALDGFTKVFWRDAPIYDLWPQVSVLLAAAMVFFLIARRLAKRWEYI
jgi:ABC-2 type transport system permease protein